MGEGLMADALASKTENYHGITILKSNHNIIKQLKKDTDEHTHHGHKVWNTTVLLMDYFKRYPLPKGCRVLEIGCGWGITGIFLAKKFNCDVTSVDIDANVFPFLQKHAEINRVDVDCKKNSYDNLTVDFLKTFDVVVGGDICFWDELTKKLFKLSRRANKAKTRVVLCDPGRQPFYDLVNRCQEEFDVVEYLHHKVKKPKKCEGFILDIGSHLTL